MFFSRKERAKHLFMASCHVKPLCTSLVMLLLLTLQVGKCINLLLVALGDSSRNVREAAESASSTIMSRLSGHGVKLGAGVVSGHGVKLGAGVVSGHGVKLGAGVVLIFKIHECLPHFETLCSLSKVHLLISPLFDVEGSHDLAFQHFDLAIAISVILCFSHHSPPHPVGGFRRWRLESPGWVGQGTYMAMVVTFSSTFRHPSVLSLCLFLLFLTPHPRAVSLLALMAHCAPKQLSSCLPSVVPKVMTSLVDIHTEVRGGGGG